MSNLSLSSWWARHWKSVRTWVNEQRLLASLLGIFIAVIVVLGSLGTVQEIHKGQLATSAYRGVPLTAAAVALAVNQHSLSEVDWYMLLADTPVSKSIYSLHFKDGSVGWIETFALTEETQKSLRETAVTQAVRFVGAGSSQSANSALNALGTVLLLMLFGLVLLGVYRLMMTGTRRAMFQADGLNKEVTFDSIVGYDEVKQELQEVLSRFRSHGKFEGTQIKPPRGLILNGPPGVGKTMFAKALANESGMRFFALTGADFADTFVGVGASRVRQLFAQARKAPSALIFLDEIDAIGSRAMLSQGHDTERLSVINQLLYELDGINESGQVLVVGATNHPELLDPALLRPGRLGKQIHIGLPDWTTRHALLMRQLHQHPNLPTVDVDALVSRTTGFSGADLTQLVEDAQIRALIDNAGQLTQEHFNQAHERCLMGLGINRPIAHEIDRVGYHELGHALVGHLYCPSRVIDKITVRGRGSALGFTLHRPLDERKLNTEDDLKGALAMLMGGRVAEQVFMGNASDGASGDLMEANRLARRMVLELGMGVNLGLAGGVDQRLGETMAGVALQDIQQLLKEAEASARAAIEHHREWMVVQLELLKSSLEHTLEGTVALAGFSRGKGLRQELELSLVPDGLVTV